MHLNDFIFFTLNDFSRDGGGTIRMKGIVNALAESGEKVILLSNTESHDDFHDAVKHVFLDMKMSKKEKRIFQFLLSFLPTFMIKQIFSAYGITLKRIMRDEGFSDQTIIYFEHLDNSMAYFLKEQKIIKEYINDTHGIAPLEFLHKDTDTLIEAIIHKFKYIVALRLDSKIIASGKGMIFVSEAMKKYYIKHFPLLKGKQNFILRDGVNSTLCRQSVDMQNVGDLRKRYKITNKEKVIFFAGNFKDLGGIIDLLEAFYMLVAEKKWQHLKLLLLGDGERYIDAKSFVKKYNLEEKVLFVGRTPYSELRNYQELSDVIVCPDKQHPYSELVPHIKYFDSLASGKVVINGSFASVREININEKYSVDFEPSNVHDLANKIAMVLEDMENFRVKYKDNKKIICSEFTYSTFAKVLIK